MNRLIFPFAILAIVASLTGCFTTEEYFFEARPDSTGIERTVQLTNEQFQIAAKVFYRGFQSTHGVTADGSMLYTQIKVKQDGSLFIMGSKQDNASDAGSYFEFETDENFTNLSTITTLTPIAADVRENYVTGPSDDYFFLERFSENGSQKVNIFKNSALIGTAQEYSSKYQPVWHLDASGRLYNLQATDGFSGSGITRVNRLSATLPMHYWAFPGGGFIRFPGFMIGDTPYGFGINGASSIAVYRGNNTIGYQNSEEVQYGYDLIQTANFRCFGHVYHAVSDETNAFVLAVEYNKFRLIKFSTATNTANLESEFISDYTDPYAQVVVKLLKSGVAYLMVVDGNGTPEDGSHTYELLKVSATESKSYGVISTHDFDSKIAFHYHDFYMVNDEPVIWFRSGAGNDHSDHLLILKPN